MMIDCSVQNGVKTICSGNSNRLRRQTMSLGLQIQLQRLISFLALLIILLVGAASTSAQNQSNGPIYQVEVEGIVTDVTINYLRRALDQAEASSATALIIQLSSDGSVLRSIRPFAGELAEAEVPVVVYVAPTSTEAGAAGTFFLSAAAIAAMAPDTSFGNSTPLANIDALLSEQTQNLLLDNVIQQLRDWNTSHGRNTDWIDRAVRDGAIINNEQAIATNPPTVDLVARDNTELLTLLEGRTVELANGQQVQLNTLGQTTTPIAPTLWEQFLMFITSPTVAFLLLVMGAIAIYAEIVTPGIGVLAGLGVVLILTALGGLLVLPVRWLSFVGVLLAFGIVGADLFVPSHGALTVIGIVILVVSALTLIDTAQAPNTFIALWAIAMVALIVAAFAAIGLWLILRTRNQPIATGQEGLVGRLAEVRKRLEPEGMVFVEGALWRAISEDGEVEPGDWVRVTAVYDLRLVVRRLEAEAEAEGKLRL
ncbi:MAG: nodulation protein NfeD [Chloroflexales bacterium]|nr:nodulation protein NfeD [Chloroflexales bacterium]